MVQRLICYASMLCLSVRLVSASDQQTGVAQPATSYQAQAATVDERGQELNSQGSPIDQLRQLADQFEAGAVGELADRMRATAKQLREMANQLEQDVVERLTYLRDDRNRIQLEIDRLSQMAKSIGPVHQVYLGIKVVEVDRSQLKRYGLDDRIIFQTDDDQPWRAGAPSGSAVTLAVVAGSEFQVLVDALSSNGSATVLAEPRIVTTSGREASVEVNRTGETVLPSGESQRDYVVRAKAVPEVLASGLLKLSFISELTDLPEKTTRRINTELEMEIGNTLMIRGFTWQNEAPESANESSEKSSSGESAKPRTSEKELVVIVTTSLVAPLAN